MILILLFVLVLMVFLFISNFNHKIIRLISTSLLGVFIINISSLLYLMAFSNYNINSIVDSYTYMFLNSANINIVDNSTLYNAGLLIIMSSYAFSGRALGLYGRKCLTILNIAAVLVFVILHKNVCYTVQLASNGNASPVVKMFRFILQSNWFMHTLLIGYLMLPLMGALRYCKHSVSITNRKNGLIIGFCYLVIDLYILAVFMFGVFRSYFVSNITLYKLPAQMAEITNEMTIFFVVFVLLIFMLFLCVYFRPFNSFVLISKYFSRYQGLKLSRNTRFMFHTLKNEIFTISLLANEGICTIDEDASTAKNSLVEINDIAENSLYRLNTLINFLKRNSVNYSSFLMGDCINAALKKASLPKTIDINLITDDNPVIYADMNLIGEAFVNMIKNSAEALSIKLNESPDSLYTPRLTIHMFSEGEVVCVVFKDNGCGISWRNKRKVFKSFFSTKSNSKNFGIGLNHVKQIAKIHNGNVFVRSKINEYTEFFFEIPIFIQKRKDDNRE